MTSQVEGYRLSAQQRRLWRRAETGAPAWAQVLLAVDGPLEHDRLVRALEDVVAAHEILRTSYHRVPGVRIPVQVAGDGDPVSWTVEDLRHLDGGARAERIARAVRDARRAPAVPATPRAVLFRLGERSHELLLTTSALAADSASLRLLGAELAASYDGAFRSGERLAYSQFAEWQHDIEPDEDAEALLAGEKLGVAARFPLRRGGSADEPEVVETVTAALPATLAAEVDDYAARHGVGAPAVLLAAWQTLLVRITGLAHVTVGVAVPARPYEEMRTCCGQFAKWFGVDSGAAASFEHLTAEAAGRLADAEELEKYLTGSYAAADPRWDVAFECKRAEPPHPAGPVRFAVRWDDVADEPAELKLECVLAGTATDATVVWHYSTRRFGRDYVRCLATQYRTLLAGLLARPHVPVASASALDAATRAELVRAAGPAPVARCLHELVEAQAGRSPDAVAVRAAGTELTYRELDVRADRLARVLRGRGVGPEVPVAVCLDHTAELPVALLAVLKAGGAYVPLDPALPMRRLDALLARVRCPLLLARRGGPLSDRTDVKVLLVDEQDVPSGDVARIPPPSPDDLAYVLFTSGSTGAPKGVMVTHRAIGNYVRWAAETYATPGGAGAPVPTSIGFDLTVTALFVPLVTGAAVHLDPAWREAGGLAAELSARSDLDLVKVTPSHLAVLNALLSPETCAGTTRSLVLGGEPVPAGLLGPWRRHAPATRVFNEYGPTEAAVGCCAQEIPADLAEGAAVPIGHPITGVEMHLLGPDLQPVVPGVLGEIYVGGEGLARGYLDDPAVTAGRFVAHPFAAEPGGRLYRTGDLGFRGPAGELYFAGRADEQVKIGGVRVEPAETRAALLEHPAVRDALVVTRTDSGDEKYLEAYVAGSPVETGELLEFLAARLPPACRPRHCTWLPEIPLTGNGKPDVGALPAAGVSQSGGAARVPPADATEAAVAALFEELLHRAPVGADEDFFDLGGHSLLAVQLIARVNAAFDSSLPVSLLFEPAADGTPAATTVRGLAHLVRHGGDPEPDDCLVALPGGGAGPPLFCVHPAGGSVLGYRELAASPELPCAVHGFQAPPPDDGAEQTVEHLAGRYATRLRRTRPDGPLLLLGWSMGGLVALEVAALLTAIGEQPGMVVLGETYPPTMLPDAGTEADPFAAPDAGQAEVARLLDLARAHGRAARQYRPAPYGGPVVLVQAAEQDAAVRAEAAAAWRALCPDLRGVHVLPGGHYSLLRAPFVAELARTLRETLPGL
ncbi:amino acid adenylation domain-containing protein [Amycolatopsis sp. NPDC098790]|uniref:non-ribosomal peptide synthetase n=1 Tax=Amycolatopsis sp. NPDC098790 TaxID=3363939 RepID=UPI003821A768